jgi:thiol-disulfide isomerase/thioredoxin
MPRSKWKTLASFMAYFLAAIVVAYLLTDRYSPALNVGDIAPIDQQLTWLDGRAGTLAQIVGRKPTVVNFWATWCPPCRKELPLLARLARKYAGRVAMVGLAVESEEKAVKQAMLQHDLNFAMAMATPAIIKSWQAMALPTTYVVGPRGQILWAKAGSLQDQELDIVLETLLKNR